MFAKNQEFELITSCHLKNIIFPKSTWSSLWSLISSSDGINPHTSSMFQIFFFLKRFLRKSSKLGHGNLVIITSTVQVGLSKWNFNFHDIKTYFFQVLRDRRQITVVTLNGSCLLSKKKAHPPVPNGQNQDG